MSVQVLPYSVEKYNKVPVLGTSAQDFQYRQGEAFVLSSLRLLLFEYKLSDTFGVVLLHRHFDLDKDEKLVDYNNQATSCKLEDDELVGGQVVPVSWRVMKTPGSPDVMPFEFEFRPLSKDKGIDLAIPQYQPFLKDFVSTIIAGGYEDCVGLSLRSEHSGGIELAQGWYLDPKPSTPEASVSRRTVAEHVEGNVKPELIHRRECAMVSAGTGTTTKTGRRRDNVLMSEHLGNTHGQDSMQAKA
ncbi:hypothetical protein LTS08_003695 [Lithohypha guttulata]|uniref:Uncharacterized protein n=1 Tax=Lithohypha guttulata TaxID=1690604 RepID=A0AAN7SXK5_9EURO|nr:hypothetical protein LTR05_006004 [Lithohypha guttulata]KAK5102893.1 hypothetical protein LTS08_003695 [Lithohypha guttulata]